MKFFFEFGENFRLFWIFVYIIVNRAIIKKVKIGWLSIDELFGLPETLFLLKVTKLIFEVFFAD